MTGDRSHSSNGNETDFDFGGFSIKLDPTDLAIYDKWTMLDEKMTANDRAKTTMMIVKNIKKKNPIVKSYLSTQKKW